MMKAREREREGEREREKERHDERERKKDRKKERDGEGEEHRSCNLHNIPKGQHRIGRKPPINTWKPDPQRRLTVNAGLSIGTPAFKPT